MTTTPLNDSTYLEPNHHPDNIVSRDTELAALSDALPKEDGTALRNLHIYGPRGSGKTHLLHHTLEQLPSKIDTCYVSCDEYDTQYKALQRLCELISGETVAGGHHSSDLQRRIERKTGAIQRVIILDEVEFLLQNDGGDLLYFLSRISGSENLTIVTVSSRTNELASMVEKRVYSSLYPKEIEFDEYSTNQIRLILLERAHQALKPNSLQREALTHIASESPNITFGLQWLKTAARNAGERITGSVVKRARLNAYRNYTDRLLSGFTDHHRLLHQAIRELDEEHEHRAIWTGEVYTRYHELCEVYEKDGLSNRRISDLLKHLELLDIIKADYHHGGQKGKTRAIRPEISVDHDRSATALGSST